MILIYFQGIQILQLHASYACLYTLHIRVHHTNGSTYTTCTYIILTNIEPTTQHDTTHNPQSDSGTTRNGARPGPAAGEANGQAARYTAPGGCQPDDALRNREPLPYTAEHQHQDQRFAEGAALPEQAYGQEPGLAKGYAQDKGYHQEPANSQAARYTVPGGRQPDDALRNREPLPYPAEHQHQGQRFAEGAALPEQAYGQEPGYQAQGYAQDKGYRQEPAYSGGRQNGGSDPYQQEPAYGGGRQSGGSNPMAHAQEVGYNGQEAVQQVVEGFAVGEEVEYYSSTQLRWIKAQVQRVNKDGTIDLDVKQRASTHKVSLFCCLFI